MQNNFIESLYVSETSNKKGIYLDYQASTPIDKRVFEKMIPYMISDFGNPHSSEHAYGWAANEAVENAKKSIATYINALDDEIIITSGATESNNLAIIGCGYAAMDSLSRKTILISAIEHKCVLGATRFLEKFGFKVCKIPVLKSGIVDIDAYKKLLNDDVLLVSVMATNNEIGVNQPLPIIGALAHNYGAIFHVDAAQGCYSDLDVIKNDIDLMSLSSHKIYGPKGIGALYINQASSIKPLPIILGGGQQDGYRSGTIPTFLAVGMGAAFDLLSDLKGDEIIRLQNLRDVLLKGITNLNKNIKVNGGFQSRHPGNINITLPNKDARQLIFSLQPHVAFSTGSACTSGIQEPSHVLKAIGLTTEEAERSLRMTVGRYTTMEDVKSVLQLLSAQLTIE